MPKGETRFCRKLVFSSAMPSPSASRSRVIRLGLGTPPPAFFITDSMTLPLRPLTPPFPGGPLVSATSTSPLGNTYSQRGCTSPVPNALTAKPAAAVGVSPCFQPTAGAMLMVGSAVCTGSGKVGLGPVPSLIASRADSPQPLQPIMHASDSVAIMACLDVIDLGGAGLTPRGRMAWVFIVHPPPGPPARLN